jgi:hypothetical protein
MPRKLAGSDVGFGPALAVERADYLAERRVFPGENLPSINSRLSILWP